MEKKFSSITGLSMHGANKGERVKLRLALNCKDPSITEESRIKSIQRHLDDIVYPEIIERALRGKLPSDFRLSKAHILMFGNEYKNKVLINEESRFNVFTSVNTDVSNLKEGDPIYDKDIKEIVALKPQDHIYEDAAHIMLQKFRGDWYFAFNFIYNKKSVRKRLNNSRDFLTAAETNFKMKLWGPFIDNLFSSTELAIQSILLMIHFGKYTSSQDHDTTLTILKEFVKNGNLDEKFLKHYSVMKSYRSPARYTTGSHKENYVFSEKKGSRLLEDTIALIEQASEFHQKLNF